MVITLSKYQANSIKKNFFIAFVVTFIFFSSNVTASHLETSASSHESLELTEKNLKPYNVSFSSCVTDEKWQYLPDTVNSLDCSKIGSISEIGRNKITKMKIDMLNLSNLTLDDGLIFLPKELRKLVLRNSTIKECSIKYLPQTLKEIDISNNKLTYKDLQKIKLEQYDNIKTLNLSDNLLTGKVFGILPEKIEVLIIERASNLSGFFSILRKKCPNIRELYLAGTWLCSEDLEAINSLPDLEILDISLCKISEKETEEEIKVKPNLKVISDRKAEEIYGSDGVSS